MNKLENILIQEKNGKQELTKFGFKLCLITAIILIPQLIKYLFRR